MEAILKDLEKLESKSVATTTALDEVQASIDALERWRDALADEAAADMVDDSDDAEAALGEAALQQLQTSSSRITDYNKEWFSAVTKYSKAVDKKFSQDLSPLIPVAANPTLSTSAEDDSHMFFASEESKATLDNVLAMHFVRSGREDIARTFLQESGVQIPREKLMQFTTLHRVSDAIRKGDLSLAMRWADEHNLFLQKHQSPLRFHLHRSEYVRLLLSDTYPLPPSLATSSHIGVSECHPSAGNSTASRKLCQGASRALKYARAHFGQFHDSHAQEIRALSAASLYLPIDRLLASPYASLFTTPGVATSDLSPEATPTIDPAEAIYHAPHLVPLFASEFCSSINMSRELPLKVVTDIGGAGALAKIAKVKGVMKEKRTEWTTVQELPVEIPLPPKYRYHSVFACPVSKEQATEANPPMMMPCGHVVANQTLMHLCKGGQNVRCPYCPLSSAVSQAIRVYF